jgi:hypothetical protein
MNNHIIHRLYIHFEIRIHYNYTVNKVETHLQLQHNLLVFPFVLHHHD